MNILYKMKNGSLISVHEEVDNLLKEKSLEISKLQGIVTDLINKQIYPLYDEKFQNAVRLRTERLEVENKSLLVKLEAKVRFSKALLEELYQVIGE